MRALSLILTSTLSLAPLLAAACAGEPPPPAVPGPTTALPGPVNPLTSSADAGAAKAKPPAVDDAALDRSVEPCNDFYAFACGGWMKKTPIPDDQATWMRSFSVITEQNQIVLRDVLEGFASLAPSTDAYAKELGDLYAGCMDEAAVEKRGIEPLAPAFAKIDGVKNADSLAKALAWLHQNGISALFTLEAEQDLKDSTQFIAGVWQGGLGLPDRDYYLDAKRKELVVKYEDHVARMFVLGGEKEATARKSAKTVVAFEKRLAEASMKRVMLRSPENVYHPTDLAGLGKQAGAFPWKTYFAELGIDAAVAKKLNLAQPDFAKAVARVATDAAGAGAAGSGGALRTYLKWQVLHSSAKRLPAKFVDEDMVLSQVLTGTAKLQPRWKRCVRAADVAMGEALARPFVKRTLGDAGKADALRMIGLIEKMMDGNLDKLSWMDATTKTRAKEKLHKIANKIGFPDTWRKYDGLTIARGEHYENMSRANTFEMKRRLAKIGKPLDRNEWLMTPPEVNAYYDSSMNEMVFPAGILQPPFYSSAFPPAVNFGAIGMVMGHELTHGFDDEGRKFDGAGNVTDWWTPASSSEFKRRAECVDKQYSDYVAIDDLKVDGKLTMGENIADLGGMKLAYLAWKSSGGESAPSAQASGMSADQQFFLGYAQGWCGNVRPEAAKRRATDDYHSPPKWRVNGVVSNMPEFSKAFACKDGAPMARGEGKRCEVW